MENSKVTEILTLARLHSNNSIEERIKHFERFRNQLQTVAMFTSEYNKALQ